MSLSSLIVLFSIYIIIRCIFVRDTRPYYKTKINIPEDHEH